MCPQSPAAAPSTYPWAVSGASGGSAAKRYLDGAPQSNADLWLRQLVGRATRYSVQRAAAYRGTRQGVAPATVRVAFPGESPRYFHALYGAFPNSFFCGFLIFTNWA